jgi:hypothetical protein
MKTLQTGDRVLHKLHPEWGVGVVLGEQYPGILVRFERSHRMGVRLWSDEWICAPGHLEFIGELTEVQLYERQEQFTVLREMKKQKERETVYEKMDFGDMG